jgi:hypothetical protein
MSDTSSSSGPGPVDPTIGGTGELEREPLWLRFLYMLGFGVLANIAFSLALFLGVVQLILLLTRKEINEELRSFSRNLAAYVGECLGYIVFVRDEKPFPLSKFPNLDV